MVRSRSGAVLPLALLALLAASFPAKAQSRAVTVRNAANETIRAIQIGPAGNLGESRLRSQLPPGAEARITYSTGCTADLRLTYASGRTEDHANLDVCAGTQITAGQGGAAGPTVAALPAPSTQGAAPTAKPASATAATPLAPKTAVPPWTGRSITRRFGGME